MNTETKLSAGFSEDLRAVRLRPIRPEHAAAWYRWREQPSSQRFNPLLHLTVEDLARRISSLCTSDLRDRSRHEYRWIVELRGEPLGTVATERPSWMMGHAEIGYMMSETHHGRGLGTRAVALLLDKLFGETSLQRIYALICEGNTPSMKLVERLGFTHEGRLREHYVIQGRRADELVYGMLRREWTTLPEGNV